MASNLKAGLLLYVAILTSCLCAADTGSQENLFSESELENAIASILQDTDDSCHLSGAMEVCQAVQHEHRGRTDFFHLCPSDGDPCNDPELCYYSSVRPCCPESNINLLRCSSKSTLFLGGQSVEVTFYKVPRPGFEDEVCFKTSPDINTLKACDCELDCITTFDPPACPDNVKQPGCDADGKCECAIDRKCECLPGYKLPDCCDCEDDNTTHAWFMDPETKKCHPICRDNCIGRRPDSSQPCRFCLREFLPPDCCECGDGQTVVNGVCKCKENTDDFGNCLPGYSSNNCCVCDTAGNDTHAYYMNDEKECIPYCKKNCQALRSDAKGCAVCKANYTGAPECCQCANGFEVQDEICVQPPSGCNERQRIYFLLDATSSNRLNSFCENMISVEILIAALSRTSEFDAILFPHDPKDKVPTTVFDFNSKCDSIVDEKMSSVIKEFRECNPRANPPSNKYPSMCGSWTVAGPGLRKIAELAKSEGKRQAVIILTDGIIQDADEDIASVTTDLQKDRVSTIIAAGLSPRFSPLPVETLRKFTLGVNENAIIKESPVELVEAIVERLVATEILCENDAINVRKALTDLSSMPNEARDVYCECVPHIGQCPTARSFNIKSYTRPRCGGTELNVGLDYERTTQSEKLEEEIVAAVESVLEKYVD